MSGIEVREMGKYEYNIWDELVESSPDGTIFHSSDWLNICSESFNKDLKIYGCFKGEVLVGGCSLFVQRKGILKIASSTCAMTPFGGIILRQSPASNAREQFEEQQYLINPLCDYIYKEYFDSIRITTSSAFLDIRAFTWNKWNCGVYYNYYLNLEEDFEKNMPLDVKQDLKKAIESGVQVRKAPDPKMAYNLYCRIFEEQKLKTPATEDFCNRVAEFLKNKDNGEVWILERESGEVIGAQILLRDNKRVYAWVGVLDYAFREGGYNYLMYFTIIQDLKKRGVKEFNLMSANVPRLSRIITAFDPKLMPYYKVYKNNRRYRFLTQMLSKSRVKGDDSFPCSLKVM